MKEIDETKNIIGQFVDYLLPELTPYEASVYLYLLWNSFFKNGTNEIQVGKRTIASENHKSFHRLILF